LFKNDDNDTLNATLTSPEVQRTLPVCFFHGYIHFYFSNTIPFGAAQKSAAITALQ